MLSKGEYKETLALFFGDVPWKDHSQLVKHQDGRILWQWSQPSPFVLQIQGQEIRDHHSLNPEVLSGTQDICSPIRYR